MSASRGRNASISSEDTESSSETTNTSSSYSSTSETPRVEPNHNRSRSNSRTGRRNSTNSDIAPALINFISCTYYVCVTLFSTLWTITAIYVPVLINFFRNSSKIIRNRVRKFRNSIVGGGDTRRHRRRTIDTRVRNVHHQIKSRNKEPVPNNPPSHLTEPAPRTERSSLGLSCPVCLESAKDLTKKRIDIMSTPCGHLFCEPCIDGVLNFGGIPVCPTCRTPLYSDEIRQIYL